MSSNIPTLFPIEPLIDKATIYHDETKKAFGKNIWGHGLLFVPERIEASLLKELQDARDATNCNSKLHFADISKGIYTPKYKCIKRWIEIGVEYLRSKKGCKLGVIFFDKTSSNLDLYSGDKKERTLRLIETVLRMVLKGGVHYLYNEDWRVKIHGIITDGEPWHRKLDTSRIINRLLPAVRDYVKFLPNAGIKAVFSNHKDSRCNDPNSAHLLQLTDLLLGSVIQSCLRHLEKGTKREVIVRPLKGMLDKRKRGRNFRHSSHYRSFTLSLAKVVEGEWAFEPLNAKEVIIDNKGQLSLFDLNMGKIYETE